MKTQLEYEYWIPRWCFLKKKKKKKLLINFYLVKQALDIP